MRALRLLFVCTRNSARSILAEGLAQHMGGQRLSGFSAGSHPSGVVHPLALAVLRERGCATADLRSKSWDVFAAGDAMPMDAVITVCDNAACEVAPRWPGDPVTVHWGLADPSRVAGDAAARLAAFRHTADLLAGRIETLLSLPPQRLDRVLLRQQLQHLHEQAAK